MINGEEIVNNRYGKYSKYSADKPCYDLTELVVAINKFLSVFPKDARDEEPVISGERELKKFEPL